MPVEIEGQEVMVGGDIILRVDRQAVTSIEELVEVISASSPGDEISLSILRDGRSLRIDVTLGERTP